MTYIFDPEEIHAAIDSAAAIIRALRLAIDQKMRVLIRYRDDDGVVTMRAISELTPFAMSSQWGPGNEWVYYFDAVCELRDEPRRFRVDRVQSVEMLSGVVVQ